MHDISASGKQHDKSLLPSPKMSLKFKSES
jgi:hypothetical protein